MSIAVVFVLFVALAFSGASMSQHSFMQARPPDLQEAARVLVQPRFYDPPQRKSMIVDPEGRAHPTADGTQMTKRDRSRGKNAAIPVRLPAVLAVESSETEIAPLARP